MNKKERSWILKQLKKIDSNNLNIIDNQVLKEIELMMQIDADRMKTKLNKLGTQGHPRMKGGKNGRKEII